MKPLLSLLSLLSLLLFLSCNKTFDSVENGYAVKYRSRPISYIPTDFAMQPNIVVMGDGYTAADALSFQTDAQNMVDHLFSVSPFNVSFFPDYFNIYFIYLNSSEHGIGYGEAKNTALRCYFTNDYGTDLVFDDVNFWGGRKAPNPFDVVTQFIPNINLGNTVVVILVNDKRIGYTSSFRNVAPYDQWISLISVPENPDEFKRLILREVGGKAFAHLAEEDSYYGAETQLLMSQLSSQYGFYTNISFTDNPAAVPWSHFLDPSLSLVYPNLGIFPVGYGLYRPNNNNVMMRAGVSLEYDAPSREAIVKRIYQIHRWSYTASTFTFYFGNNDPI